MLQTIKSFLRNSKLEKRFTILLLLIFLGGTLVSGSALAAVLNHSSRNQITTQALVLLKTMSAIRQYTDTRIAPELSDRLDTEFLPQSVPSYSAREVFEEIRQDEEWSQYFYKEATLNPTNLRDRADDFETALVRRFQQNPNIGDLSGFRTTSGGDLYYIARPLIVTQPSCLECHSTPDRAPQSLIEQYGTENGFNWQLNEIIGAQTIYVPSSRIFRFARQSFFLNTGIVLLTFAAAISLVNFLLKRYVVKPLHQMTQVAEAVSIGDMDAEFEHKSNDEIGGLALAFTRMKNSLAIALRRLEQ